VFADHRGMQSLGLAMGIGSLACMYVACVVLPLFLRVLVRRVPVGNVPVGR